MRRTPYDIAFGPEAEPRFAELRASLARTGRDPHDADAFVLDPEVVRYLRELVPEEGVGEAVAEHVALLHHAYLYWDAGGWLLGLSRERAQGLLTTGPALPPEDTAAPATYYAQFPARLVWAALAPGEPHQPLDGLFVSLLPSMVPATSATLMPTCGFAFKRSRASISSTCSGVVCIKWATTWQKTAFSFSQAPSTAPVIATPTRLPP